MKPVVSTTISLENLTLKPELKKLSKEELDRKVDELVVDLDTINFHEIEKYMTSQIFEHPQRPELETCKSNVSKMECSPTSQSVNDSSSVCTEPKSSKRLWSDSSSSDDEMDSDDSMNRESSLETIDQYINEQFGIELSPKNQKYEPKLKKLKRDNCDINKLDRLFSYLSDDELNFFDPEELSTSKISGLEFQSAPNLRKATVNSFELQSKKKLNRLKSYPSDVDLAGFDSEQSVPKCTY